MVTELGKMLKEARMEKGLSIDDIHKTTKIQKRYLKAIEEGNFDVLPGHFYARAFVKSYAEAVDVDVEYVLDQIQPELSPAIEDQIKPLRRTRSQVRPPTQTGRWLTKLLLYLFAVLILFVIYIAISDFDKSPDSGQGELPTSPIQQPEVDGDIEQPSQQDPENAREHAGANGHGHTETNQPATPPSGEPQPSPSQPTLSLVKQENKVYRYELTGASELDVMISAKGNCWMEVRKGGSDGKRIEELTLKKGDTKQYKSDGEDFWISLGSAPDLEIKVNGQALDTSKMKRALQIVSISLKK